MSEKRTEKLLKDADVMDLLGALRKRSRDGERLSRGKATEVRHTLLYLSQDAMQLRDYVVEDAMRWTTAAAELEDLRCRLDALIKYVNPEGNSVTWNPNEIGGASIPEGTIVAESHARREEQ